MDAHSLKVLEFDKLKEKLSFFCHSDLGKEKVSGLSPSVDPKEIEENLNKTSQFKEILLYEEGIPSLFFQDIREALKKVSVPGFSLEPQELLDVATVLACSRDWLKFFKDKKEKYSAIQSVLNGKISFQKTITNLKFNEKLYTAINKAIEPSGEIKDSASEKLAKIRREKNSVRNKILDKLNSILAHKKTKSAEDIITLREGRFVIPVKESETHKVKGIVHDKSSTGLTFYIEPTDAIELNNQLKELDIEERNEIHRILRELSEQVRLDFENLSADLEILAELDFVYAKAKFSIDLKSDKPVLNQDGYIRLVEARHPFLDAKKVVPLTIELGKDYTTVIITGPNTGGKTVALKAIGLLTLMVQAGLEIPAEPGTEVNIFTQIFADIGDEQSIEMSLSTFSSHIRQIINAIQNSDRQSLVLLDEIGVGTDPKEGAALGEAILNYLTEKKVRTLATTHFGALKVLAQNNPQIRNASFEFDTKSLQPTYRFQMGLPGASYAIEIASRLGLKPEIVQQASGLVGTQEKDLTSLIQELEENLKKIREQEKTAAEQKVTLEKLVASYQERLNKIQKEEKEVKNKALKESKELIEKTKSEMDNLVKEIRDKQAEKETVKKASRFVAERKEEIKQELEKLRPEKIYRDEKLNPGDLVWVESLNSEGEILAPPDKSGKVRIKVGKVTISVSKAEVYKKPVPESEITKKPKMLHSTYELNEKAVSTEIDLRGLTAEEAMDKVDQYLDQVYLSDFSEVSIIHGKGTGALRKKLTEFLKKHPRVENTRLGQWNEGGIGVTIVKIKK